MKSVLVIAGDYYHTKELVERGLGALNLKHVNFDYMSDAANILHVDMLQRYDLIVNCKMGTMSEINDAPWPVSGHHEVCAEHFEQYVAKGKPFLCIHAGMIFKGSQCADMAHFVGSNFLGHPPRCEVEIKIKGEHPITSGVHDFIVSDEHYQIKMGDNDIDVLFETVSKSGGTQVGGYVKNIGAGKICVLTPGHYFSVWENASYKAILINAIEYLL